MNKTDSPKYSRNLSVMRISAAMAVILLHTCTTLSENRDLFTMQDLQASVLSAIANLMRWSVPVFFMLTGTLLLNPEKKITYKDCVFHYVKRIVLALAVFGIPFAMMKGYMENHGLTAGLIMQSIIAVLQNQSLSHLWYLYELIGIYLVLPLIRPFVRDEKEEEIRYALIVLGIFDFVIPAVSLTCGMNIAFHVPLQYSLFYVLAGWYLFRHAGNYPVSNCGITAVCCALLTVFLTMRSPTAWLPSAYDSPLAAVFALCIFCLFINLNPSVKNNALLWEADRLCFAVYLIHPVFIQFTYRFLKITPLLSKSVWFVLIIVFWIIFCILAFAGAWILRKIPFMKKYIL